MYGPRFVCPFICWQTPWVASNFWLLWTVCLWSLGHKYLLSPCFESFGVRIEIPPGRGSWIVCDSVSLLEGLPDCYPQQSHHFIFSPACGSPEAWDFMISPHPCWRRQWQPTPVLLPGESQGQGEPGGLPSMGSHRVRHDWSDLAAAAAATSLLFFCIYVFIIVILMGKRWYLFAILICGSLMPNNFECLFMCLLAICVSFLEKCLFKSFVQFWIGLFVFVCPLVHKSS